MVESKPKPMHVWVALNEVTDPRNFLVMLCSLYFLGASGVVVCARNSAPLSRVVSKASAGALEVKEKHSYRNMVQFLERSMENGWQTVGASSAQAEAVPARDLPHCLPTILVLGNEGRGLRTNVKRAYNKMVCIPGIFGSAIAKEGLSEGDFNEVHDGSDCEDEMVAYRGESFIAVESLNVCGSWNLTIQIVEWSCATFLILSTLNSNSRSAPDIVVM